MAKIGLSLSGGGLLGLAHIGVLKVIDRLGIQISAIAGCSMGSIIGTAYAAGRTPEEMEQFILSLRLHRLVDFSFSKLGIKKMSKFEKALIDFVGVTDFSDLQIPLYINATNITEGKERIFYSGNIMNAIHASTAYPGVFAPLKIKNNYYIDGGVINNQPFPILPKKIKKFITVNITPKKNLQTHERSSILTVLDISIRIMQEEIADLRLKEYKQKNYTIIKPHIDNARIISPEKTIRYIINSGELAAQNHIPELKRKFKIK
ncbi:MAG: patatin-like phospholipase family protein [Patescibacteria group bacterium]|jgi:NTE family protein